MGIPAPVIVAEQADHTALGGGNSGICGNALHTYGFHLDANSVGPDDYSRWRDPNGSDGPYVNWNYCCAGDFRHGGNPTLRAMHRDVLARLMRGELPMICEFIGQPWADQPVYYWARWNGVTNLQRYNGAGHDLWSHISWYRSTVNQRAFLWTPQENPVQAPALSVTLDGTTAHFVWNTPANTTPNEVIFRLMDRPFPQWPVTEDGNIVNFLGPWGTAYDVPNLVLGTTYYAQVYARNTNPAGWGPPGAATLVTAKPSTGGDPVVIAKLDVIQKDVSRLVAGVQAQAAAVGPGK